MNWMTYSAELIKRKQSTRPIRSEGKIVHEIDLALLVRMDRTMIDLIVFGLTGVIFKKKTINLLYLV